MTMERTFMRSPGGGITIWHSDGAAAHGDTEDHRNR
ncbi:hypothetical protein HNQ07_000258 [Deinococcus metalli]|uniref:Uncharacterized protein n=1 Tax=Deinococcus metalli TaxID=1141878 RepID=A0A7W8KAS2_9DEIO|nr:hypothetical protein [Deinococcus metalli]